MIRGAILANLLVLTIPCFAPPAVARGGELRFEEFLVAGGPQDFATVRHLRLEGSHFEIGRRLAELAMERHGWVPPETVERRRTAAQRRYFERNSPFHFERMRGVADWLGLEVADDSFNLSELGFGFARPGCTVAYYPPSSTSWGTGVVSRNFDFTTGTFSGDRPGPGQVAVCSQPYVIETIPDRGFASISLCSYDLLGGVVDGMNEQGLTVALLADDEAAARFPMVPAQGPQAGFEVLQIGRHLLETCSTVEEAQATLLEAKLYYSSIPCHYLIADRHGRSFVWENSVWLTQGFIFEGGGRPQVTTNFLYQLHSELGTLPAEEPSYGSFNRYRAVLERIRASGETLDLDEVRGASACVAAALPASAGGRAPGRTLWHALYFPEERRVEIDFYLGEDPGGAIRRSGYRTFSLPVRERAAPASATASGK